MNRFAYYSLILCIIFSLKWIAINEFEFSQFFHFLKINGILTVEKTATAENSGITNFAFINFFLIKNLLN